MTGAERRRWLAGCAIAMIAFELGGRWTSHHHIWADAWWIAVDVFAALQCLRTARVARPEVRTAWRCFTIAIVCWTCAMLVWAFYELVLGKLTPYPSLVDVLGWIGSPFFIAGIFFYKTRDRSRILGLQQIADLALTVAVIVALAIDVLYVPASDAHYPTVYVASALTTSTIAVTALAFGLLTLWQHIHGARRYVLGVMLFGLLMLAVVSVLYSEALLAGRYRAGRWIDGLWVVAFLAFAFGAREERSISVSPAPPAKTSPTFAALVPTVALVVWMAAWLTSERATLIIVNTVTGAVLAGAFYLRIWATQRLEATLAARVAQEEARAWQLEARLTRVHKLEAVGTLAGGVAHDFNNLLMAATAALKLARRRLRRGEDVTRDLDEIDGVLWRAADLTSRLLDLARKREPKRVAVDPRDAVERVRVLLAKVVPSNVQLSVECEANVPAIVVDPSDLDHALLNLGLNARDVLRERGGTIRLRLRRGTAEAIDGVAVVIEVTDDGPGIPPDVLPHVFEPFFTTKSEHGTGLGLAMVDTFATSNAGAVSVTSGSGGTTFRLAFPAATVAVEPVPASTSRTVLVVSREDASGLAMAGALERAGIAAVVARDTDMAVAEAKRVPGLDAVVVDAGPDNAGRESVRELRAAGVAAAFVLVVSAGGDESGEWNAVVTKPYDARMLVDEVERATAKLVAGPDAAG